MVQLETQGKYDPWGKPGGGAPITKEDHKLRRLNPQAIISPNQAGGVPIFVVSKPVMSFPQQSNTSQSFLILTPPLSIIKRPPAPLQDQLGKPGGGNPISKEDHKLRRINPDINPDKSPTSTIIGAAGGDPTFLVSSTTDEPLSTATLYCQVFTQEQRYWGVRL